MATPEQAIEKAQKEATGSKPAAEPTKPAAEDTKVDTEKLIADAIAEAKKITSDAKAEAKKIKADAKASAGDLVSRSVSRKELIEGYDSGLNHMQLADKFFGSHSEENVKKVSDVINEEFEIYDNIDAEKTPAETTAE